MSVCNRVETVACWCGVRSGWKENFEQDKWEAMEYTILEEDSPSCIVLCSLQSDFVDDSLVRLGLGAEAGFDGVFAPCGSFVDDLNALLL